MVGPFFWDAIKRIGVSVMARMWQAVGTGASLLDVYVNGTLRHTCWFTASLPVFHTWRPGTRGLLVFGRSKLAERLSGFGPQL